VSDQLSRYAYWWNAEIGEHRRVYPCSSREDAERMRDRVKADRPRKTRIIERRTKVAGVTIPAFFLLVEWPPSNPPTVVGTVTG
jgi:hypothetical protein